MPLTESQAHALALRFQHWDRDRNGFIEWSDLEAAVARLAEAFGRNPGAPERGALVSSCRKFWRVLLRHADADHDGRISQDEYVAAFGSGVMGDPGVFDDVFRALLADVMRLADADGDGRLGEEEFVRLMGSWYNAGEADAAALFELLDTDGDGHLSHGEFVRAASDRFVDEKSVSHAPPASR
ncbi:EF-hand domain-containing protein [Actinoallomurus sp. CA-142502]|uniref:EF-hand domain-containing protein n=1 Tax=Actinoallomurus sp. CA-142502 TaxID=3239885 RepID=UPI003D8A67DC